VALVDDRELPIEPLPLKLGIKENAQIDFKLWRKVKEVKLRFFRGGLDPRQSSYVPVEVAESWIRSKNYGVDPFAKYHGYRLPAPERKKLAEKKKMLMETAIPMMKKYLSLLSVTGYGMLLTDENGVVLYIQGADERAADKEFGTVLNEQVAGTNAHSLCAILRKPVQFIGPYNYCVELDQNIVSSTPIFFNGQVVGTLTLYQLLADETKDTYNMQVHSLGWITSLAAAIENQLKLLQANQELSVNHGILEATLSVVEGGIITLNKDGIIVHVNREGANILGQEPDGILGKHYFRYIKEERVENCLKKGLSIADQDISIARNGIEKQYMMRVTPVITKEGGNLNGTVIHLSKMENIKKLVNDWRGATATYTFDDIKYKSSLMRDTVELAKQYASIKANVLIQGESGTGKELFAHAIHNLSRPEGPFIAINCSAMPRNLIESELFGYEGGAFTGAERKGRPGLIELAHGGTLFLDEIGDMPLELQPVLLRVLESKKVMRVGGRRYIPVDFRVICATNKDLRAMIQKGTFREDLYYRLAVLKLQIPPLRERREDIGELVKYFINNISAKMGCRCPTVSPQAMEIIQRYDWPGNVRQLENALVCAVSTAAKGVIEVKHLPEDIVHPVSAGGEPLWNRTPMSLEELEKMAIAQAMRQTGNNVAQAAEMLQIGKSTLYKKLKLYDIRY